MCCGEFREFEGFLGLDTEFSKLIKEALILQFFFCFVFFLNGQNMESHGINFCKGRKEWLRENGEKRFESD